MASDDWGKIEKTEVNIVALMRRNPEHASCDLCIKHSKKNPLYIGLYCQQHDHWLSWINEWSKLNCKKYGKFDVGIRAQADVDSKYYRLWPWMIWDIIIGLASKSMDIPMYNEVISLWNIYKLKFTSSQISRKLPLIIWAAKYLTTPCDWKLKLIEKESILFQEMMNINIFFKSFKTQCTTLNTSTNVIIQNNYKKKFFLFIGMYVCSK
jgi:hypothetical protein